MVALEMKSEFVDSAVYCGFSGGYHKFVAENKKLRNSNMPDVFYLANSQMRGKFKEGQIGYIYWEYVIFFSLHYAYESKKG